MQNDPISLIEEITSVKTFLISQATTHKFRDLYIFNTMLVLIQTGSKSVKTSDRSTIDAHPGELLVFPSGTSITIENRIISGSDYSAWCVSYPDALIRMVFDSVNTGIRDSSAIHLEKCPKKLVTLLKNIGEVQTSKSTPKEIILHRICEPLIWLKSLGIFLSTPTEKSLEYRLRDLITSEPGHRWRANDVAAEFGYSEATLRRRLQQLNTTFSAILMNVRLEYGLSLLQTTQMPISQIALESGFSTPSHFSEAFRTRFDIPPKYIRKPKI